MTEQEKEAFDAMRQDMIDIKYGLEGSRTWGGMDWTYHPMHPVKYLPLRDKAEKALAAADAVEQQAQQPHIDLLHMLANRARNFPHYPMGYHMPEVFAAIGEQPPAPKAQEDESWQPIETAPKDGEWILAINANSNRGRPHVVRYYFDVGVYHWKTGSGHMDWVAGLTHWMPLPKAPKGMGGQQ